jgi:hypothetical protein
MENQSKHVSMLPCPYRNKVLIGHFTLYFKSTYSKFTISEILLSHLLTEINNSQIRGAIRYNDRSNHYPSARPPVRPSTHPPPTHPSIHPSIYLSIFIPVVPNWSIGHPWNASFHFSFLDDRSDRRKAATYTQTQNKHRQTSTPWTGFEHKIPVVERAKTFYALDPAATVISGQPSIFQLISS